MKKVVIESPLSGDFARNLQYARLCALDCVNRGEAPYASHLLMTQFLDDRNPEHRKLGMKAGFAWGEAADLVVVYRDLGISHGMEEGIQRAKERGKPVELRVLPPYLWASWRGSANEALSPTPGIESPAPYDEDEYIKEWAQKNTKTLPLTRDQYERAMAEHPSRSQGRP